MAKSARHDGRRRDQLRPVKITPDFVRTASGSCLIEIGGTRVICTASFVPGVPKWREASGLGWMTAEYAMLPASTGQRKDRRSDGRSVEIQRIIGRVLRNTVDFAALGANTVYLDCDVLEADGGTRTAAITGAYVALALAVRRGCQKGLCHHSAAGRPLAAVSVGVVDGECMLDLDYSEDSAADVDANVAMTAACKFVEIQVSSERASFGDDQLADMLKLARKGVKHLHRLQRDAIREAL